MLILNVAVGNKEEAFIQNTPFSKNDINIISSDDNNRGKTILIQSMMYCFGNTPTFPSSFEYKNYYYVVKFQIKEKNYLLCRKDNTFILKDNNKILFFNNLSEFKRYWNKSIFILPSINKNGEAKIIDPELFLQLFFVGQDKKDSSNIVNRGFYNKDDFYNMLCSILQPDSNFIVDETFISDYKTKIGELKDERSTLIKKNKILQSPKVRINYLSVVSDKNTFEIKLKEIEKVKEQIANLKKSRNVAINRKLKYEITIKEINSLNRTIEKGELQCLDCGSTRIGFKTTSQSTFSFDVSTPEIRNDILASLNEKIHSYQEEIEKITNSINTNQSKLQTLLSDESVSLESLVAYKYDIVDVIDIEKQIIEIDREIEHLNNELNSIQNKTFFNKETRKFVISSIVKVMNETYKKIDPTGNLFFDDLFTKKETVYSGSEAIIFHLVKLYAIAKVLNHNYPIIVDSFRAEDLSSNKEKTVLKLFSDLNTQIIFTTTLKKEECGKYDNIKNIHHIDFTIHTPSKMLQHSYVIEFINLMKKLSLEI